MNKNDVFAFPCHFNGHASPELGMTLRDYFASKAMQGMCANPECRMSNEDMTDEAWNIADLMLKGRSE